MPRLNLKSETLQAYLTLQHFWRVRLGAGFFPGTEISLPPLPQSTSLHLSSVRIASCSTSPHTCP